MSDKWKVSCRCACACEMWGCTPGGRLCCRYCTWTVFLRCESVCGSCSFLENKTRMWGAKPNKHGRKTIYLSIYLVVVSLNNKYNKNRYYKIHLRTHTFLMKSFPAEFTNEGFVSGVNSCMSVESWTSVESFATLVAFMRFFLQTNVGKCIKKKSNILPDILACRPKFGW